MRSVKITIISILLALPAISAASPILETFKTQTQSGYVICSHTTEAPVRMAAPPTGSGLTWGGHTNASVNTWQANLIISDDSSRNRLELYADGPNDSTKSANYNGTYFYTIFNTSGGIVPEVTMDLQKIEIALMSAAPGQQLRWLIRDDQGRWFLSQNVTSVFSNTSYSLDVPTFTGWLRVNTSAENEMNQLDADTKLAIDELATLSIQTPDLTKVTGGGVYIEQGNTDSSTDPFILTDLNWIPAVNSPSSYYIATTGSDSDPGTEAQPFATLQRARDEIRTQGIPAGGVTGYIRDGAYVLSNSFSLSSQDSGSAGSPVTYQAYPGETVTISGAKTIDPAAFSPVTSPAVLARLPESSRNKVLVCDLTSQGITDYGQLSQITDNAVAEAELFLDNKPMTRAQWPNEGFTQSGAVIQTGSLDPYQGAIFEYTDPRIEQWGGIEEVWVVGFWDVEMNDSMKVVNIDTVANTIETAQPPITWGSAAIKNNRRMFFVNVFDELDIPTEYYISRSTGNLYYYPPTDLAGAKIQISMLDSEMINMQNVSHVRFKDLVFEASRARTVGMSYSSYNSFIGCTFRNMGTDVASVWMGQNNEFIGCDIYETGSGGIRVFGGDRNDLTPGNHFLDNNHYYNCARRSYTVNGWPARVEGVGHSVTNSLLHGSWRGGFSFPGNDHLFEYNEVCNIIKTSNDTSAIGSGFNWTCSGTDIRYNFMHNYHGIPTHSIIAVGVYVDDGLSGNNVYQNVFYDLDMAFFSHGGRGTVVDNNLMIDCDRSFNFMDPSLVTWWGSRFGTLIDVLYDVPSDQPLYTDKYPHLLTIHADLAANAADPANIEYQYPKDNVGTNNLIYNSGPPEIPANALAYGTFYDNYQMADGTDAGFVDPATLNFELEPDSPVYTHIPGFQEIPFDQIGLYTDAVRTTLPSLGDFKLFLPEDVDSVANGTPVDFYWQSCQFADQYDLEIATDPQFTNIIRSINKEDMCYSYAAVTVSDLPDDDIYYWRVRAFTNARSMNLESKYNAASPYHILTVGDPVLQCGDPGTEQIYDISGPDGTPDCYVNFYDFAAIASEWTKSPPVQFDLDNDNAVNLNDLQLLISEWLNCTDPQNVDCITIP